MPDNTDLAKQLNVFLFLLHTVSVYLILKIRAARRDICTCPNGNVGGRIDVGIHIDGDKIICTHIDQVGNRNTEIRAYKSKVAARAGEKFLHTYFQSILDVINVKGSGSIRR